MKTLDFSSFTNQKKPTSICFFGDLFCNSENALESVANGDPFFYLNRWMTTFNYRVANLETPITGKTEDFPTFSASEIFAKYLSNKFDLLFTANNHSLDQGKKGVIKTIEMLDTYGINHIGTSKPDKVKKEFSVRLNGYDISFLNYTTAVNGKETPEGFLAVDVPNDETTKKLINFYNEAEVKEEINLAKKKSDIVIVSIHRRNSGDKDELTSTPVKRRIENVHDLVKTTGADFVLGMHPHLFQGGKRFDDGKFGVYSLGDGFSDSTNRKNAGCVCIMKIDSFENISYSFLPIATVNTEKGLFILPLAPLTEGAYNFIDAETQLHYIKMLSNMRKIFVKDCLVEEIIPVHLM